MENMEDNIYENDGQGKPKPPDNQPPGDDALQIENIDMEEKCVRDALSEPGIVMVNCAGTNVAVQVIPNAGPESTSMEERNDADNGLSGVEDEQAHGDAGSDGIAEDEPEADDEHGEAADIVAPTSAPIMNSSNLNIVGVFKSAMNEAREGALNDDTGHDRRVDDLEAGFTPQKTERRRSTRKRKSTPVYRLVAVEDDPMDDIDDDEGQVTVTSRRAKSRRKRPVKNETGLTDDDEYHPSTVAEAEDEDIEDPEQGSKRGRSASASKGGDHLSSPNRHLKVKKKNTLSLGSANMERWVRLKEELGVSQDYQFSKKILEFLEDNLASLKKAKKPKTEDYEDETPSKNAYNPHASESSDPFVCIKTNWEVKRWYMELVSHAKRSTSGFLAHLLRVYCTLHTIELPSNNALYKYDMENESTPGDKVEEICNCDGNNFMAEERRVDTSELDLSSDQGQMSNNGLHPDGMTGLPGYTKVILMGLDSLKTSVVEANVSRSTGTLGEGQEDYSTSADFRQGFAHGASGSSGITSTPTSTKAVEQRVSGNDEDGQTSDKDDSSLPLKKQKLKRFRALPRRQEYGPGHPPGITKEDYILHEIVGKDNTRKKYYECALCHKMYKSWSIFAHIRIHKGEKHCCRQCGKHAVEQRSRASLKRPPKKSTCSFCPFFSTVRSVMKEHVTAKHPDELAAAERFLCEQCGKELKSKASLKDHRNTHLPQIKNKICDLCGKAFTTRRFLRIHINGVHGNQKYPCTSEGCDLSFSTRNMVRTHVNRVHLHIKKVKCSYESCARQFYSRSELQQHIRVYHTKEKLFTCTWEGCGKTFRTPYHVQVHTRIHTDEKPLKCPHCDYRARQRNALNWHLKKHDPNPTSKPAAAPKPRPPRPPKQKPLPPLPRHENFQHEQPQPSHHHHQPRLQAPYQPHHHLTNQYEFSGIPPNPFGQIPVDNNGYSLPYPQQSVFPPGGMQYQSL